MYIDNNQINFQAKLYACAKISNKEAISVVKVFKLTDNDKPFIKRCLNVCYGKDRFIHSSDKNIGAYPTAKKGLLDYFKAFLVDKKGNYYMAIRNNKIVSGILRTSDEGFGINEYTSWMGVKVKMLSKSHTPITRVILNNNMVEQNVLTKAAVKDLKLEVASYLKKLSNKEYKEIKTKPEFNYINFDLTIDNVKFEQNLTLNEYGNYYQPNFYNASCGQKENFITRKTPETLYNNKFLDETEYNLAEELNLNEKP